MVGKSDGLGRRTVVIENDNGNYTETRYLWCGERICQARNASDGVIRRYYDEGEQLVTSNGNTPLYYAQDHLGSVRDLVDASGSGLASYDYDPYGQPTRSTASGSTRADYRYAGLFYHAPSGLYLTHCRAYDPVTARWLSRDPVEEGGGVNLYGYVMQNPVNNIDLTGEFATAVISAAVTGIAVWIIVDCIETCSKPQEGEVGAGKMLARSTGFCLKFLRFLGYNSRSGLARKAGQSAAEAASSAMCEQCE